MSTAKSKLSLLEILCRLHKCEAVLDEAAIRRAAKLASMDTSRLTDGDRSLLEAVASGEGDLPTQAENDKLGGLITRRHLVQAMEEVRKRDAARTGRPYYKPTIWDVAIRLLKEALSALMQPHAEPYINPDYFEREIATCCERYNSKRNPTADDSLAHELESIGRAGFTDGFVRALWHECPQEASELRLPKPRSIKQVGPKEAAWKRLRIRDQKSGNSIAELDGKEFRLTESAAAMLVALKKAKGQMIKAKTLSDTCGERADRILAALPSKLRRIVDAPGKGKQGYRMR